MLKINSIYKQLITEVSVGTMAGGEVFMNPPSIMRMEPNLRAIIDSDGNLYVVDAYPNFLHIDIVRHLQRAGVLTTNITKLNEDFLKKYTTLIRVRKTNTFMLSSLYTDNPDYSNNIYYVDNIIPYIKPMIDKCKIKNPKFDFEYQIYEI
jgi:hypothetical protein